MPSQWKSNTIGLISIGASLLAFINKEYRLYALILFTTIIIFYIISSFSDDIDRHEEEINKLQEKLKIHEQLIDIKADLTRLNKEVFKK